MKVHITSNGGLPELSDITLEDGTPIDNVEEVVVMLSFQEVPRATIEIYLPEVDITCEAEVFVTTLPNGKRYRLEEITDAD